MGKGYDLISCECELDIVAGNGALKLAQDLWEGCQEEKSKLGEDYDLGFRHASKYSYIPIRSKNELFTRLHGGEEVYLVFHGRIRGGMSDTYFSNSLLNLSLEKGSGNRKGMGVLNSPDRKVLIDPTFIYASLNRHSEKGGWSFDR